MANATRRYAISCFLAMPAIFLACNNDNVANNIELYEYTDRPVLRYDLSFSYDNHLARFLDYTDKPQALQSMVQQLHEYPTRINGHLRTRHLGRVLPDTDKRLQDKDPTVRSSPVCAKLLLCANRTSPPKIRVVSHLTFSHRQKATV